MMDDLALQRTKQAVEAEAAARSTRAALGLLAGELGVSLKDLDESEQNLVALRFVLDGRVSAAVLQGIVDDVGSAEGLTQARGDHGEIRGEVAKSGIPSVPRAGSGDTAAPAGTAPPGPRTGYRFNATEATDAKYRERMATVHRLEDHRSGLDIRPRRPDPLGPLAVHPPCKAAFQDGGECCSRCAPLLHDTDCECPSCDYALGVQE